MTRHLVPWVAIAAACAPPASGPEDAGTPRYNVLLVTLDTTRADHLSCYGHGVLTTPTIDALARDGARFERAISSAGLTPMAHASILTGLPSHRHGLRIFHGTEAGYVLPAAVETLAERLAAHGWQTAARVSAYPASAVFGLDQGFDSFETGFDYARLDLSEKPDQDSLLADARQNNLQRRSDAVIDDALAWLDQASSDAPWFLWLHLFDAHDYSLVPPAAEVERFGVSYDRSVQPRDAAWNQRLYDPEIAFMDRQLGRLLDVLDERADMPRTIVVVTADHGEGLEDGWRRHQWAKHRLLYDWCLRVPLVLSVPGRTTGEVVPVQVRTLDIPATVLDALGLEPLDDDGESLLPLLDDPTPIPRIAFAEALNRFDAHTPPKGLPPGQEDNLFCVSDGRWKLIWHADAPDNHQLFDLEADPRELQNLAASHPEELARLEELLRADGAFRIEAPDPTAPGPQADALHALGYGGNEED